MSKEVKYLYFVFFAPSFSKLHTVVYIVFVFQEIMSQAKKVKVEESVMFRFILIIFFFSVQMKCKDTSKKKKVFLNDTTCNIANALL